MSDRPHGKHVYIDPDNPEALGICDFTGFVHLRKDLVKHMEWRGNALAWTGFYVGRDYVSEPNPQLRPPILPPDPVPVLEPRLPQPTPVFWSNQTTLWPSLIVQTWGSWAPIEDGTPCLSPAQRLQQLQTYSWSTNG